MPPGRLHLHNIHSQGIAFLPDGNGDSGGSCHIKCPPGDKLQFHTKVQMLDKVDLGPRATFTEFDDKNGNRIVELDHAANRTMRFDPNANVDFNSCSISNLAFANGTNLDFNGVNVQNFTLPAATLNPENISSANGFNSLDAELDTVTTNTNLALARTQAPHQSADRVVVTTGSGVISSSSFAPSDIVRRSQNQTITGTKTFNAGIHVVDDNGITFGTTGPVIKSHNDSLVLEPKDNQTHIELHHYSQGANEDPESMLTIQDDRVNVHAPLEMDGTNDIFQNANSGDTGVFLRLNKLETQDLTISGNKTFSGTTNFTGAIQKDGGALDFHDLAGSCADSQITSVSASKVSGELATSNIPGLSCNKLTSDVLADARLPTNIVRTNVDNQVVACSNFTFSAGTNNHDAVVTIQSDTNNATGENNNPFLLLRQDGGGTRVQFTLDDQNDLFIGSRTDEGSFGSGITLQTNSASKPIKLKVNGAQIAQVNSGGISLKPGRTYMVDGTQIGCGDLRANTLSEFANGTLPTGRLPSDVLKLVNGQNPTAASVIQIATNGTQSYIQSSSFVGPQGPEGPAGPQGSQGVQGVQGDVGPQGPAGAQGAQGPAGNDGNDGAAGAQGPAGAQGAQGAQGPAGATGAAGADGNDGANGSNGADGQDGNDGAQGAAGADGNDGAQGIQGIQGVKGDTGDTGPPGSDATATTDAGALTSGVLGTARIPNHSCTKLTSGTLADARLSSNIPRLNANLNHFENTDSNGCEFRLTSKNQFQGDPKWVIERRDAFDALQQRLTVERATNDWAFRNSHASGGFQLLNNESDALLTTSDTGTNVKGVLTAETGMTVEGGNLVMQTSPMRTASLGNVSAAGTLTSQGAFTANAGASVTGGIIADTVAAPTITASRIRFDDDDSSDSTTLPIIEDFQDSLIFDCGTGERHEFKVNGSKFFRVMADGIHVMNGSVDRLHIKHTGEIICHKADGGATLQLENGQLSNPTGNESQIAFSYNGNSSYRHFIRSRHASGNAGNSIDFLINQQNSSAGLNDAGCEEVFRIRQDSIDCYKPILNNAGAGQYGRFLTTMNMGESFIDSTKVFKMSVAMYRLSSLPTDPQKFITLNDMGGHTDTFTGLGKSIGYAYTSNPAAIIVNHSSSDMDNSVHTNSAVHVVRYGASGNDPFGASYSDGANTVVTGRGYLYKKASGTNPFETAVKNAERTLWQVRTKTDDDFKLTVNGEPIQVYEYSNNENITDNALFYKNSIFEMHGDYAFIEYKNINGAAGAYVNLVFQCLGVV